MTVIELPTPPSTNNLFITAGRKRVISPAYRAWRQEAAWMLAAQRPIAIPGPVAIDIAIEDKGTGDIDNRVKAALDLLVSHKVIEGDSRKFVRSILAHWSKDVTGCRVEIWEAA